MKRHIYGERRKGGLMRELRDIVVIIPGITGSVLEKDGREV
jgi:hypothetical protein